MSSNTRNGHRLKKHLISAILKAPEISPLDAVNVKLALNHKSISDLAKEINVSRQAVHLVLAGQSKSKRITEAIRQALGFDPWA